MLSSVADVHSKTPVPEGMIDRFMARARSEGFHLGNDQTTMRAQQPGAQSRFWFRTVPVWTAAASVTLAAVLAMTFTTWESRYRSGNGSRSRTQLGRSVSERPAVDPVTQALLIENDRLKVELQAAGKREAILVREMRQHADALASAQRREGELNSRITVIEGANAELRDNEPRKSAEIAQLRQELAQVRSEQTADRTASLVGEAELTRLRDKVTKLSAELDDERQLNAAVNEARDLIVARNLHIVDVNDADENGKRQRAFGRIFYAEGQKLVFYAYDLSDPRKISARDSFYVWGEQLGANEPARSLGMLRRDDEKDGRWVLRFSDRHVLAHINSVFVTVESGKNTVAQPTGKRVLFAFLGNKANHP
jgi:hypothetical protein